MRKRINRAAIASSDSYSSSKRAHIAHLQQNHEDNKLFFMGIVENTKVDPLVSFEEGLKQQIAAFRAKRVS